MIKKLLKNNILLSGSSFISLVINIISIPIISRIYTPENIGLFASLQIICMIFFLIKSENGSYFWPKNKNLDIKTLLVRYLYLDF